MVSLRDLPIRFQKKEIVGEGLMLLMVRSRLINNKVDCKFLMGFSSQNGLVVIQLRVMEEGLMLAGNPSTLTFVNVIGLFMIIVKFLRESTIFQRLLG